MLMADIVIVHPAASDARNNSVGTDRRFSLNPWFVALYFWRRRGPGGIIARLYRKNCGLGVTPANRGIPVRY
jgi:hypothetical protein